MGWMLRRLVGIALVTLAAVAARADMPVQTVAYPAERQDDSRHTYFIALLDLALAKTEADFGPYRLAVTRREMVPPRAVVDLAGGTDFDVLWTATTPDREELLHPIRIPLDGGLLGYRIFIIRKDRAADFAAIRTLEDLRRFTACQGSDWPDRHILEQAGLTLRTSTSYDSLFKMLAAGRCDFFPRALHEPFKELEAYGDRHPDLMVEPLLMMRYPNPMNFFNARSNLRIAERLEAGLERALADGSFHDLLYGHPSIAAALAGSDFHDRRIFDIANPLLPRATPLDRAELWFDPARVVVDAGPINTGREGRTDDGGDGGTAGGLDGAAGTDGAEGSGGAGSTAAAESRM